jgi:hypothetical protein
MYEIYELLGTCGALMKIRTLSAECISRNDRLRLEAIPAGRTAGFNLTQGCYNASLVVLRDDEGKFCARFFC